MPKETAESSKGTLTSWRLAAFILLFAVASSSMLVATPGYFNHDELRIIDSVAQQGMDSELWSFEAMRNKPFFRPLGGQLLEISLWHGYSFPILAHGLSVLLHALVCLGVFFLISEFDTKHRASWAACLFAVSPLAAFAVGWVVAIYDVLLSGLLVLALYAALRAAKTGSKLWWTGFVLATVGAMFTKETWVILPFFVLLLRWIVPPAACLRLYRIVFSSAVIVAGYVLLRYPGLSVLAQDTQGSYAVSIGENVIKNLLSYLIFPFHLFMAEITGIVEQSSVPVIAASLGAVAVVIITSAVTANWGGIIIGALFYLGYLLPILPIGKIQTQYLYGAGIPLAYFLSVMITAQSRWAKALGVIGAVVLTLHTAIIQINFYETGLCQSRLIASLDTLFARSLSESRPVKEPLIVAPADGTPWWILARTLYDSEKSSNGRRYVKFERNRDKAQLLFTKSCAVSVIE